MIYKNNKKVKKYTLNWSREARKEYVGMLYVNLNNNSYIVKLSKEFSKNDFKYYKDSMERFTK